GGIVVTDNPQFADKLRSLKFHGLGVDAWDRQSGGRAPQAEVLLTQRAGQTGSSWHGSGSSKQTNVTLSGNVYRCPR
ncbi:hypothetical protein MJI69_32075, partial [Salmonella enterica subsp. enterica serovar Anatum]|nr:hypothetical protein [Salmonella enterica subsp. enterica serovar Anatum]